MIDQLRKDGFHNITDPFHDHPAACRSLLCEFQSLVANAAGLPQEIGRQILPDGCHAERSPAVQLAALQDLTEIRALLVDPIIERTVGIAWPAGVILDGAEMVAVDLLREIVHGEQREGRWIAERIERSHYRLL